MKKMTYNEFLEKTEYVDYDDPARNTYYFVRDEIKHSWDARDRRVTEISLDATEDYKDEVRFVLVFTLSRLPDLSWKDTCD